MLGSYKVCLSEVCKTSVYQVEEWSVLADEDSLGWKAGVSMACCLACSAVPISNARTKQATISV